MMFFCLVGWIFFDIFFFFFSFGSVCLPPLSDFFVFFCLVSLAILYGVALYYYLVYQ